MPNDRYGVNIANIAYVWEQRKFIDIVERLNKTEDNVKLPRIEFEDIVSGEGRLNKDLNTKKR